MIPRTCHRNSSPLDDSSAQSCTDTNSTHGPTNPEEVSLGHCPALIEVKPKSAHAWSHLVSLLGRELARSEEAEQAYRKAIELDPDSTWTWGQLGDLLNDELDRYEEAEQAFRKAIELEPDLASVWAHLGEALVAIPGRQEEAEQACRKAVELEPESAHAWTHLGRVLEEVTGRHEEAVRACQRATELEPDYAWSWKTLARLLHKQSGRFGEAERAYLRAIELEGPSSDVLLPLVTLRVKREENPNVALQEVQSLLDQTDRNADVLNSVAWALYKSGREELIKTAEALARESVNKKEKDNWSAVHTLASILGAEGEWNEALKLAPAFSAIAATRGSALRDVTEFLISAAAAGYARDALKVLINAPTSGALEPLEAGLKLFLNEMPQAAHEVVEIGRDVAERIRQLQARHKDR